MVSKDEEELSYYVLIIRSPALSRVAAVHEYFDGRILARRPTQRNLCRYVGTYLRILLVGTYKYRIAIILRYTFVIKRRRRRRHCTRHHECEYLYVGTSTLAHDPSTLYLHTVYQCVQPKYLLTFRKQINK